MSSGQQAGDVARVENPGGTHAIVLVCEHASAAIPSAFGDLGLSPAARESHIAWDPGALAVARAMSERLNAVLVRSCVSRLVYDCNRPPEAADAMPARSEVFDIPGNAALTDADRAARIATFYRPFEALLDRTLAAHPAPVVVTIHSFTPVYAGRPRAVEIGVLHDADARLADALLADPLPGLRTERNAPYGPQDGVTHTLCRHALPTGRPNVMLEIRNDLIATPETAAAMGQRLADWLSRALSAGGIAA